MTDLLAKAFPGPDAEPVDEGPCPHLNVIAETWDIDVCEDCGQDWFYGDAATPGGIE